MLSAATRAARGAARSLVAAVVGTAGTVIGAMVGFLTGFVQEDGLLKGALVGAVTGALVSVELADSLLRIWTSDGCPMDTRIKRTRLVLRSFAAGRLLRGCVFPVISGALDAQMEALRYQPHNYMGARDDPFEPSSPVMAARRAAVESLPATTLRGAADHLPHLPPGVPNGRERQDAAGLRPRVPPGVHRQLAPVEAPVPDVPPRRLLASYRPAGDGACVARRRRGPSP